MNNTHRIQVVIVAIVITILILIGGLYFYKKAFAPSIKEVPIVVNDQTPCSQTFKVESPVAGSAVSFPVTLVGSVDNSHLKAGCPSWIMFEGQAGTASLYYETKNGWSLPTDTQPIKVADWTSTSTTFSVTLNFDNKTEEFPSGYNFKVVFTEENPSGQGVVDSVEVPLTLK